MDLSKAEVEIFKQQVAIQCLDSAPVQAYLSQCEGILNRSRVKTLEEVMATARKAQMQLQFLHQKTFSVVLNGLADLMSIVTSQRRKLANLASARSSNAMPATEQRKKRRNTLPTPSPAITTASESSYVSMSATIPLSPTTSDRITGSSSIKTEYLAESQTEDDNQTQAQMTSTSANEPTTTFGHAEQRSQNLIFLPAVLVEEPLAVDELYFEICIATDTDDTINIYLTDLINLDVEPQAKVLD